MARDYRESTIQLDHTTGEATIWTCIRPLRDRLKRLGWAETHQQIGGWWLSAPIRAVVFRKTSKTPRTPAQIEALSRMMASKEKHE